MSTYFGLDIGSSQIKVCKVFSMGDHFRLEKIGLATNSLASLNFKSGRRQKLIDDIHRAMKEAGINERRVVVSVPETQVYATVVPMPVMPESEIASAIRWEAEQFVPVPIEEVELDYAVIRKPPKGARSEKMLIYVVAARKEDLEDWVDFLVEAGLEPIALENETVALARTFAYLDGVSLILNLGALSTSLSILDSGSLMFSHALEMGGVAMTRALAKSLSLELLQAEQYKTTYGLKGDQFEGKVREAILLVLDKIVDEVKKAVEFFANNHHKQVKRILLAGGGAYMPELGSFLTDKFPQIEVLVADPFLKAKTGKGDKVKLPELRAIYSVAVGLARRQF